MSLELVSEAQVLAEGWLLRWRCWSEIEGEFEIDYQLLIYPMIDDSRATETASWSVPIWNPESNHFGWSSYLGNLFESEEEMSQRMPHQAENWISAACRRLSL